MTFVKRLPWFLGSFGLSLSDAVRVFLHRVVASQSFPLELKVPNETTAPP
ncbi:type II toxin-antitoxin system RelB/DinJ family antitoxin [Mesorhizobium calcicola]|uniref:Type II toxin-antitoxin system RelB/DinJ family antitoxin n=1 Tax=Mesorhizobium calcicola TaxID=1300310 RepID=A0ABW4WNS0_9HYPH